MTPYRRFDLNHYPPPLLTDPEDDYFSYNTITTRKPKIVQQVLDDHAYPNRISRALQDLQSELAQGQPIRPLKPEPHAPDAEQWHNAWLPYREKTWFEIPWFLAEVFFYRRLLEAVEYFGEGEWAEVDPFLPRKQVELAHEIPWKVLDLALDYAADNFDAAFCTLLRHCIWGNRVDLSHPHIVEELRQQAAGQESLGELIVDDTDAVLSVVQQAGEEAHFDFICDNAGTELLLDLALADFFLRRHRAKRVTLHVKFHPTYVSDTIPRDIDLTLEAMQQHQTASVSELAVRLFTYLAHQRLVVKNHLFWNSDRFFWEFPADIETGLRQAALVIIKGDANYRRLLGDAHWPPDVAYTDAVPFFPAPFVTLRTMKSNVITGLQPGQAEALAQEDPNWRVNGRRGVIQGVLK